MKNTFSRVLRCCVFPATTLLFFAAASCGDDAPKPASGNGWSTENVLVYHWRNEPGDLHPTNGASNARRMILDLTQRFIISTDIATQTLRPDLIKAMPAVSADELQYTFELRDDIKWDDGSPLTMDDILFTYKANLCPYTDNPQAKPYFDFLQAVVLDAANPLKFTTIMKQRYIQNLAYLVDMPIMQRTFYDPQNALAAYSIEALRQPDFTKTDHPDLVKWANEFNKDKYGHELAFLQGLGAYKITAWENKARMELTLKKNAATGTPGTIYENSYPEKIILKINENDNSIGLELKDQVIDASAWLSTDKLLELQQDSNFNANYKAAFVDNYDYQYIGLNLKPMATNRKPFFTDRRVRRALALLTPLDDIIKTYYHGKARRVVSCISPLKAECSKDLTPIPYDMEQAKKLLDEAGWIDTDGDNIRDKMIDGKKTPFEFELLIATRPAIAEVTAKEIAASCYKAGIRLKYRTLDGNTLTEKMSTHDFDAYMSTWVGSFFPDDPKQIWHSSNWSDGGSNFVGFNNPLADRMIDSIRVTTNDAARNLILNRLQHLIYEEQPYVFMYTPQRKVVAHRRFENTDFYNEKPCMQLSNFRLRSADN